MTDRTRRIGGALLLFALTLGVYWPCLGLGFVFDDSSYLLQNEALQSPTAWHDIWLSTRLVNYYPVFFSLLRLQWQAWGVNPVGYHAVNLLVHAANAAFLYLLLARWRLRGAWVAALLFALHPLNVQTVAWISEEKNTLSMLFLLATAWVLLSERRLNWVTLGSGTLLFCAALLTKPSVICFPFFLALLWFAGGKLRELKCRACLALLCAASIAAGAATIWFENHRVVVGEPLAHLAGRDRIALVGETLAFYARQAFAPIHLALFYPGWSPEERIGLSFLPDAGMLAFFIGIAFLAWRKRIPGFVAAAIFYYAIMLLPFLGLANTNFFRWSIIADHWQYHALPGAALLLAEGIRFVTKPIPRYPGAAYAGLSLLCAFWFATLSWSQMPHFKDDLSLSSYGIERNPRAWLSWYNLGTHLAATDRAAAILALQKATELKPDYYEARFNLANELLHAGRFPEAEDSYHKAIEIAPSGWDAYANLGVVYMHSNRDGEAEKAFNEALAIHPDAPGPLKNLTLLYIRSGRYVLAEKTLPGALKAFPMDMEILQALQGAMDRANLTSADLKAIEDLRSQTGASFR